MTTALAINLAGPEEWPDGQARILDTDLATLAGMGQPRDIRKVIKGYEESGDLGQVSQRATIARYENRPGIWQEREVEAYYLDEEQALFILAKLETAPAKAVTRGVIKAFVAARHGSLQAPAADTRELSSLITGLVRSMREDHVQRSAWASRVEQQQTGLQREVRDGMASLSRGLHATDAKIKGVIEEQVKTSREVGRLAGDIASLRNIEKREFRDRDKRRMRRVVLTTYGGMCPCCGDAKILESMHGQVFGQYDHWYSRRRIEIHEGWLVCLDCNQNRLGEAGNESRRPSYRYRFDSFHEHLAKIEGEGRQLSIIDGGKAGDGAA